jgi:protein TonB
MSYVSVYENKIPRSKGLILTGAVHAVIIAAVIAMPGIEFPEKFPGTVIAIPVPAETPPEPVRDNDQPEVKSMPQTPEKATKPPVIDLSRSPVEPVGRYSEVALEAGSGAVGEGIPIAPIKITPDPVIVNARIDSRYGRQFQPAYPAGQLRLEREGEVSVRVLIGSDGRVKQIELIDSPHADFWIATRKQALQKWRFTPATKDGKPMESWLTLKVRFEINA